MKRRVVKLGGSTLSAVDYVDRLQQWSALQTPAQTIVVVGGGIEIGAIARSQQRRHFSDAAAHWMCIDVMGRNVEQVLAKWPTARKLAGLDLLPPSDGTSETWLLDPRPFMEHDARQRNALPESWDVSSDSIAARVAHRAEADELVLLKSRLPRDLRRLGRYVDPYFTTAAKALSAVRFVNLRDARFSDVRWR